METKYQCLDNEEIIPKEKFSVNNTQFDTLIKEYDHMHGVSLS